MIETTCRCGQAIPADLAKYGKRYCSARCRAQAKLKRRNGRRCAQDAQIRVACTECGAGILKAPKELARYPRSFCGNSCKMRYYRRLTEIRRRQEQMRRACTPQLALPPGPPAERTIKWTPEYIRWYQREQRRRTHGKPWISGTCAECGRPFLAKLGIYCDNTCQRKAIRRRGKQLRRARIKAVPNEPINLAQVAQRDRWQCHICQGKVTRKTWSLDHLIPLSHGGSHTYANVALAHHRCNTLRSNTGHAQLRLVA